jgi:2-polyprenyl-6-methoxyphenol hydroxylase-like FAD-dependent oxidoreductase
MDAEVLVAGAGPVGLATALALARRGVAVLVLEKREALSAASRASTFHPPTLEALDDLGVLEPLLPGGEIVPRLAWMRVDGPARAALDLGLLAGETRFPIRWHREQREVTPALAAALPSGSLRFGAEVVGVAQGDDRVAVHLADGTRLAARYLLGCDGAAGAVRAAAGIAAESQPYGHRVLRLMTALPLEREIPFLGGASYLFDAGGSCSLLRMPGVWRIILRIPPEMPDAAALSEDHARANLRRFLPALADLPIAGRDVYGVSRSMARAYRAGRVLLAGDAAHLTNTRGGMNMNAGIHDGMTLASTLAGVLRGGLPEAALEAWAAARLAVVEGALLPRTDRRVAAGGDEVARMQAIAADPEAARAWLREAAMLDIAAEGAPA